MATSELSLTTPDGPMPAALARPDGPARGGVVVVQEAFGVTSHIEAVCQRFADAGWVALAPALFHREGAPVLSYDHFDQVMPLMRRLTAPGILVDLDAALAGLADEGVPAGRRGVVGFCMGGSVALVAAVERSVAAAVTYYGGGLREGRFGFPPLIDIAPRIRAPWLGHFGDLDKGIPVADVDSLREAAATAPAPTQVLRYDGADHGFNCDDRPAVFDPAAAALAWERTLEWLDRFASG